ncbi:hypothetical protein [Burkholderia territorii]|uniref:hypothetical protein n=1 Tax=Burkholderia territorii TaxID=1503055 RepID=UPI00075C2153|nr:hypothetical protein [Burkholderia territorii]KWA17027.1 hypothetical protein WT37_14905 [Burkholderia territorii]KWA27092.1 hypothetical protein WT39_19330 [Burkholderia territorii]
MATTARGALVALLAVLACGARADGLPPSIATQLPAGYRPMVAREGPDLGDGRRSFLVVVHRAVDTRTEPSPRPLLIFEEQPGHAYRLAARNDHVVLRANEGGQCDPFDPEGAADSGLAVKGRYFTVQNFVACGQHWSDYVTFRHDPRTHGWLFSSEIYTESFPLDDKPDEVTVTRADAHRPVTFGQWRRKD